MIVDIVYKLLGMFWVVYRITRVLVGLTSAFGSDLGLARCASQWLDFGIVKPLLDIRSLAAR